MKLRVGILGPGAIGGLIAGLFWKAGYDVFCVGRHSSVSVINEEGLHIESPVFGDFVAYPKADIKLTVPVDILFITLKSPFLKDGLANIDPLIVENAVIIPLLNGVGHCEIIRSSLGAHVAVGMIGLIEVASNRAGVIQHISGQNPHIDIASDSDISEVLLIKMARIINNIGISTSILSKEADVIWKKLVRLSAIASTTAAFQKTVGTILTDQKMRKVLKDIVQEGALVAQHEGVNINPDEVITQIESLPETLMTSLQRDVETHTPSEVESITGGVLKLAKSYNIQAPAHKYAYDIIRNLSSV
jgi:2-dehydropantoate 2-reductase